MVGKRLVVASLLVTTVIIACCAARCTPAPDEEFQRFMGRATAEEIMACTVRRMTSPDHRLVPAPRGYAMEFTCLDSEGNAVIVTEPPCSRRRVQWLWNQRGAAGLEEIRADCAE